MATASVVEAYCNIHHSEILKGDQLFLSPQQILDCVAKSVPEEYLGSMGGYAETVQAVFRWSKQHGNGFARDESYEFRGRRGRCRKLVPKIVRVTNFRDIKTKHINKEVMNHPVIALINTTPTFEQLVPEIYYGPGPGESKYLYKDKSNHFIVVVGHGRTREGEKFWIVRNSWGTEWGEGGYGKIVVDQLILSPQQILDCVAKSVPKEYLGSMGGYAETVQAVFRWSKKPGNGFTLDSCYEFRGRRGRCRENVLKIVQVRNFREIKTKHINEEVMKHPVIALITITPKLKKLSTEIYYGPGPGEEKCIYDNDLNHFIVVVGLGRTREGEKFWIVRNSWSTKWGDGGYGKVSQNKILCEGKMKHLIWSPKTILEVNFW